MEKNMFRKLATIIYDFFMKVSKQHISAYAASTAFFSFISMIPMLALLCSILPYTSLTQEDLVLAIDKLMPELVVPLIQGVINEVYMRTTGVISIAAILMIWSAGKGMMALIQGLDAINGVDETRNYFVVRILASMYTLGMLVAIIISMAIMVFGEVIIKQIKNGLEEIPNIHYFFETLIPFRFLLVWAVLTLIFTLLYWLVPNKKMKYKPQLPGAMFAAILWSAFSWGFSVYVDRFNGFSMYGSFTFVVVIMLWFYFCMYIILIGAQINRYFSPVYRYLFGFAIRKKEKRMKKEKLGTKG